VASVADPHHFDPDPDRALLFHADLDPQNCWSLECFSCSSKMKKTGIYLYFGLKI